MLAGSGAGVAAGVAEIDVVDGTIAAKQIELVRFSTCIVSYPVFPFRIPPDRH